MRESWLSHLADPQDGSALVVDRVFNSAGDQVMDGVLVSKAGRHYPVMHGVPVFIQNLAEQHADWLCDHADSLEDIPAEWAGGRYEAGTQRVQDSFGYEWSRYHRVLPEYDSNYMHQTGLSDAFYAGKVVLDAGCGYGRHTSYVARLPGTMVVGFDLSEAVFIAFETLRDLDNVVLAQGDLFHPPVQRRHFDFVYSWGVLHHTPSVEEGFRSIRLLVRPGVQISFGAYRMWNRIGVAFQRAVRTATCRLPRDLLYWTCYAAMPLNALYFALLRHIPGLRELTRVFIKPSRDWRICHTDTFDWWHPYYNHYHTLAELEQMVAAGGLELIESDRAYNSVRAGMPKDNNQTQVTA